MFIEKQSLIIDVIDIDDFRLPIGYFLLHEFPIAQRLFLAEHISSGGDITDGDSLHGRTLVHK
jgi:hypothetical protein